MTRFPQADPDCTLFDVDAIQPKRCKRCAATNLAHCDWDAQHTDMPWERRPKDCLNQYSPETAEIPY